MPGCGKIVYPPASTSVRYIINVRIRSPPCWILSVALAMCDDKNNISCENVRIYYSSSFPTFGYRS